MSGRLAMLLGCTLAVSTASLVLGGCSSSSFSSGSTAGSGGTTASAGSSSGGTNAGSGPLANAGNAGGLVNGSAGDAAIGSGPGPGGRDITCDLNETSAVCGQCQREKCCEALLRCAMNPGCACLAQCLGESSRQAEMECRADCEIGMDLMPEGFGVLLECMTSQCPDGDECAG